MITTFGEIMLRLGPKTQGERITQATDFLVQPGGSESNVAIALSNLGLKTSFITAIPDNPLSTIILQQLNQFGVNTDYIIYQGERLGLYWTETGIGPRNSYVIYDRDNSAFCKSKFTDYSWNNILKQTSWFHFSGISPAVSQSVAELLKHITSDCTCPYSVDLNYREKLWNWLNKDKERIRQIMMDLCQNATLIAGNESDFQNILGFENNDTNEEVNYTGIAEQCFKKFNKTKYVSISNRKSISATQNEWNGYLFVRDDTKAFYKGMTYMLDSIQDRVGTGDSFVAGIIYGLHQKTNISFQEVIDFAVSLSALNHTINGDASRFSVDDVMKTLHSGGSGRILR